jgi:hypothetical protein
MSHHRYSRNYSANVRLNHPKLDRDVFVQHPQVEPTNNRSERNLCREAEVRKGDRTSKTPSGAQRRSMIMTVLATLNTRFEKFTLQHLLDELARWSQMGLSRFQLELSGMALANPPPLV